MKHPGTRELYAYWNGQRGLRCAPERDEIDPGDVRRLLPDCFILAADAAADCRFRLAGTRLCLLFSRELKGERFIDLWGESDRPEMRQIVRIVTHEAMGVVAGASGRTGDDQRLDLELLLLPLAQGGRLTRLLGLLTPMALPYWIGVRPLGPMAIRSFRHLLPDLVATAAPELHARRSPRFVVYEGGIGRER